MVHLLQVTLVSYGKGEMKRLALVFKEGVMMASLHECWMVRPRRVARYWPAK
jgi:hypothetical protein